MSRYRKIDPRIWNDEKFRGLSDGAKLVFFMLLTHPNMTALGAMRATLSGLAEELGWLPEDFRKAFQEACAKGMAEHDARACFVSLPNFLRYNQPESPNVVKAWVSSLDLLPECDLKTRVIARARGYAEGMTEGFAKALPEAFAKAMPKSMPYQEQEQEQEQEEKKDTFGVSSPAAESPPTDDLIVDKGPSAQPCPHEAIIAAYHKALPALPSIRQWTPTRRKALQARWREDKDRQTLEWWRGFFAYVVESDFLTGRSNRGNGHGTWECSLPWLLKAENFAKVLEGHYENRKTP